MKWTNLPLTLTFTFRNIALLTHFLRQRFFLYYKGPLFIILLQCGFSSCFRFHPHGYDLNFMKNFHYYDSDILFYHFSQKFFKIRYGCNYRTENKVLNPSNEGITRWMNNVPRHIHFLFILPIPRPRHWK